MITKMMRLTQTLSGPLLLAGTLSTLAPGCSPDAAGGRQFHSPNEPPGYDNHQAPGASAHDLLSADKYQSVLIEIQAMQGFAPADQTKNDLRAFITARVNKPGGVTVVVDPDIPPQNKGAYSLNDVGQLEAQNRKSYTSGTQLVSYFLFLDGASTDDDPKSGRSVLAYAYQNTSMAVFEKTIKGVSGPLPGQVSAATLETTVVEHEYGHILGLTNLNPGSPMQTAHQDVPHGYHCTVQSCLMYWSANTSDVLGNLLTLGGTPPALDAQCLADLRANGGK